MSFLPALSAGRTRRPERVAQPQLVQSRTVLSDLPNRRASSFIEWYRIFCLLSFMFASLVEMNMDTIQNSAQLISFFISSLQPPASSRASDDGDWTL